MLKRKDYIRYSRQMMFPAFGERGQEKLLDARVAIVGLGGLGCPVVQYLAGAGIGQFTLIDDDVISLENLHRQLLYREQDIGHSKAEIAARQLKEINPSAEAAVYLRRMAAEALAELLTKVDIVLDCTDSIDSRLEINRAAVLAHKAHVIGTGIRAEGQLISFDHSGEGSPCFACVMSEQDGAGLTCAESGVFGPVLGVIGAAMAMSAVKYLSMPDDFIANQWQFYDAMKQHWMTLDVTRSVGCGICGQ